MKLHERIEVLALPAVPSPAGLVIGAQAPNARGAASTHAHAFRAVHLAFARKQSYAMRGPLSCSHSSRKVRCGAHSWLASVAAARVNRSIHTDTHVHRAAQRRLFMGAGDFQR